VGEFALNLNQLLHSQVYIAQLVLELWLHVYKQHGQHIPRAAAQDSLPPFALACGVCFTKKKEIRMRLRSVVSLLVVFSAMVAATAQTVKRTAVSPTSPASGQEMFVAYCASCHGTDAKGNGPAASALKQAPANLTNLAKQNGGKFPELKVYGTIKGDSNTPAHGSKEMPIWGSVFQSISHGDQGQVQLRISNLTKYIESLQAK